MDTADKGSALWDDVMVSRYYASEPIARASAKALERLGYHVTVTDTGAADDTLTRWFVLGVVPPHRTGRG